MSQTPQLHTLNNISGTKEQTYSTFITHTLYMEAEQAIIQYIAYRIYRVDNRIQLNNNNKRLPTSLKILL